MPFGRKSLDPAKPKPVGVDRRQITATDTKAVQPRNLSNGPPSSAISSKAANHRARNKRPSVSSDEESQPTEVESSVKRSKVEQKQLDAIASPDGRKRCADCKTTETSTWRRDVSGNLICNKCGLRKRKDHKAPSRRSASKIKVTQIEVNNNHDSDAAHDSTVGNPASESKSDLVTDPRPPRPWANAVRGNSINLESRAPSSPPVRVLESATNNSASKERPSNGTQIIRMTMPVATGSGNQDDPNASPQARVITPSRRPGPKKAVNPRTLEPKICLNCGTDESPAWRKDKEGNALCNKCMLRQKRAAERKPGQIRRRRKSSAAQESTSSAGPPDFSDVTQNSARGASREAESRDSPNASRKAARTESQTAYDTFTHLNSQPSSTGDEHNTDPTRYIKSLHDFLEITANGGPSSMPKMSQPPVRSGTHTGPSVISRSSFYGLAPSEKSTTMVSRAESRAAAEHKSMIPHTWEDDSTARQSLLSAQRSVSDVISAKGGHVRNSPTSLDQNLPELDFTPDGKRRDQPFATTSEDGSADLSESRSKSRKAPNRDGGPCARCSTTDTPLWRKNSQGQDICNKCGISERRERDKRLSNKRVSLKVTSRGPSGPSPLVLRTHAKNDSSESEVDMLEGAIAPQVESRSDEQDIQNTTEDHAKYPQGKAEGARHADVQPTQDPRDFWSSIFTSAEPHPRSATPSHSVSDEPAAANKSTYDWSTRNTVGT